MAKAKFDQDSAIKSILGIGREQESGERKEEKSAGRKGRPKADREIKKRVSLAVFPSLYGEVQKIAYVNRTSVSDILSGLMEDFVAKNTAALEEYDKITGR